MKTSGCRLWACPNALGDEGMVKLWHVESRAGWLSSSQPTIDMAGRQLEARPVLLGKTD
jgi:hypothetical protein